MLFPVLLLLAMLGTEGPSQYVLSSSDPAVNQAGQLLNSSQPSHALDLLRPAVQRHPSDPAVLLLAGLAAYRSDHLPEALHYWSQSLDLAPNRALNAIYQDAQRETDADHSSEKLLSTHIALRYEAGALPVDAGRAILATLEEDYARISAQLGCTLSERVVAIVQSREQYRRATSAAEWSGGHYDGRIHVAWPAESESGESEPVGSGPGPQMRRALAHELVHACLMSLPSGSHPWPVWLQEGLAQKLSGDTLQPSVREELRQLAATHGLPRLEDLGLDWFSMPRQAAVAAYELSLAAADTLFDDYSVNGISKILTTPEALPRITADLDAKLGL